MQPTENPETLERRYAKLGVVPTNVFSFDGGYLGADRFRCLTCGTPLAPDAKRPRYWHRCPNQCNRPIARKAS